MTNRERILAVYRNKPADRIPLGCYSMFGRLGRAERIGRSRGLGLIDNVVACSLMAPPFFARNDCLSEAKNCEFDIAYRWINGELIEIHKFETPVGVVTQHLGKDPAYGSYWRKKHYVEDAEDYKIVQYIVENTVFKGHRGGIAKRLEDVGDDGVVFARVDRSPYQKILVELARPDKFLMDLFTNPGPANELMETIGHKLMGHYEMALDIDAELVWIPDNITADMTPPYSFEKYHLPFYEKVAELIHGAGKVMLVHMDGKVNALKDLIAQTPIDVIESFTFKKMSGDMDIGETKSLWPQKVVSANFPSNLSTRPRDEIIDYLEQVKDEFGDKPFMITLSEDIPWETYEHVANALTEFINL